jgi:hypothetical protein
MACRGQSAKTMYEWESQVRKDYIPPDDVRLKAVRDKFEALRKNNRTTVVMIYLLCAIILGIAVALPYAAISGGILRTGVPDATIAIVLTIFNLIAPKLLAEADHSLSQEEIFELYGKYFSPEAHALMQKEIKVSLEQFRLVIALISAVALFILAIQRIGG